MTRSRPLLASATILVAITTLAGCGLVPTFTPVGSDGPTKPADVAAEGFAKDSVTVQPLYVAGDSGGVAEEKISVRASDDGELRVEFSENEVNGFGDMTRAASWNAVTVATLLTGAPLGSSYTFAFDGAIDGPSAGGLTTAGVLSLIYGDEIDEKATMTGTINPTGTIGTVGGIPEKVQGVIDDGSIDKVVIPAGQRNSTNSVGDTVDVVALGQDNGVEVVEVATIYEAYEELTGEKLAAPASDSAPKLSDTGYDKLKSGADNALARFDRAQAQFFTLDEAVQALGADLALSAADDADRAADLEKQGLQAGAFVTAQAAAATMEAVFETFDTVESFYTKGIGALEAKIEGSTVANNEFVAQLDAFGTYTPKTLTDVEALVSGYGNAFDAYSLLQYANGMLDTVYQNAADGVYASDDEILADALLPLIYFEFSRAQLQFSKDLFDIGRDNDGGEIADAENIAAIGSFLRRGADANWAAFSSGVLQPNAESLGVSNEVFLDRLGGVDLGVALSQSAQRGQQVIEQYIGEDNPNAAYAAMGYGYLNYARNASLIEKYYNNGVLDEDLNLVGVNSDTILTAALDLGKQQVSRAAQSLTDAGTASVIAVGSFEQAGVLREGDVTDKFDAISGYSESFMIARALAFIGGFERDGWSR